MKHDDLMPRERAALEKDRPNTPPPPRPVVQAPAPAAVTECAKCHIKHRVDEACPGCGRKVLLG
jgi:hypothetical protein